MTNIIIQISKYIIILLMAAYTFSCFSIFTRNYEDEEKRVLIRQDVLLFLLQMVSFFAMYTAKKDLRILFIYAALAVVILGVILLYNLIYPSVSRLVVNNMCMLITAGMIMITRLSVDSKSPYGIAVKQLAFVIVGVSFGLIVPVLIRKMEFLENWTYIYAGVGGAALLVVALFAATSGGAKLSFNLGPVSIQPSEFVKILFVFYVASSLKKSIEFKNVVVTTAVAAAHVLILVISTDLGAALIYFVVYLIMLYVATRQPLYAVAGVGAGCGAAVIGYHIFSHIKVRVAAWQDSFCHLQQWRIPDRTVAFCNRFGRMVWYRTFQRAAGYDSGSGDGSDLFCDHGGNRDDLFSLSDSDLRELLCDVFKYCDGTAESVL